MRHRWRSAHVLDAPQTVGLSRQGIELGDEIKPWSALSDVAFVRHQSLYSKNEELWLWFGLNDRRRLRWAGDGRQRAAWRAMLVDFACHGARHRPDMTLRDGPDKDESRVAARIGLGVMAVALTLMAVIVMSGPTSGGALVAGWIGSIGAGVGGAIWWVYSRPDEPPRIGWAAFAAREGRLGELPAN